MHRVVVDRRRLVIDDRLHDVQRAGLGAARHHVDKDRGIEAARQREGQIHSSDPEVDHLDTCRPRATTQVRRDRAAPAIVAEEDIADTRDEDLHGTTSSSSERK
jgi:hypothetical protein